MTKIIDVNVFVPHSFEIRFGGETYHGKDPADLPTEDYLELVDCEERVNESKNTKEVVTLLRRQVELLSDIPTPKIAKLSLRAIGELLNTIKTATAPAKEGESSERPLEPTSQTNP